MAPTRDAWAAGFLLQSRSDWEAYKLLADSSTEMLQHVAEIHSPAHRTALQEARRVRVMLRLTRTMAGQAAEATAPTPRTRHERQLPALDLSPLATLLARIDAKYHPEQVWLFGSRARGDARPTSDWDLLIVVPDDTEERDLDPVVAWRLQRGSGIYADVIPCWAREYREDQDTVNTLAYEVAREGVLIYER